MLLNASMPCLRNTPVGELIQKQGANECVDQKPKEALRRQVIFHVLGEGVVPARRVPGLLKLMKLLAINLAVAEVALIAVSNFPHAKSAIMT